MDDLVKWKFSKIDQKNHMIDSVWWCFGEGNEAVYVSEVLPMSRYRKYRDWIENGVDVVALHVDETKQHGLEAFVSYRMNGADVTYQEVSNLATKAYKYEVVGELGDAKTVPTKKDHPDWTFPVHHGLYFWNYANQGLRNHKLAVLRELAEKYGIDGLELDFTRHGPFSPPVRVGNITTR